MKSRVLALSALALLTLAASAATAGVTKQRHAPIDERALKSGPTILGPGVVAPEDTVNYSGDTTGQPTFNRAFADCSGLSGLGANTNYEVQDFTVSAAGNYDISSVQTGFDGLIHLYTNAFDPLNPLTNCTTGNDDGSGGIGTSDIVGVALAAGTQYFVVTSGFEGGLDFGPYDNTLSGPGTIVLGGQGPNVVISKTTAGVALTGQFDYDFTVTNNGPGADTGVAVTDTLPAQVAYVSDNCGGGAAGQLWTWNIGSLADGASANCTVTVQSLLTACTTVSNTATVTADGGANRSSTATNATDSIQDGGFEDGTPNSFWAEASTNFGTPICDAACGLGGGTGAHSGSFWTWFGGITAPEEGSMTQSVIFPSGGSALLTFYLEAPTCSAGSGADDFMEITVDGTQAYLVNATSPLCNVVGYTQQSVDLSAYADGAAHTVAFHSITNGQTVNFFVDDVALASTTCVPGTEPPPAAAEVPTLGGVGVVALAGLLALAGFFALRRRTA